MLYLLDVDLSGMTIEKNFFVKPHVNSKNFVNNENLKYNLYFEKKQWCNHFLSKILISNPAQTPLARERARERDTLVKIISIS